MCGWFSGARKNFEKFDFISSPGEPKASGSYACVFLSVAVAHFVSLVRIFSHPPAPKTANFPLRFVHVAEK